MTDRVLLTPPSLVLRHLGTAASRTLCVCVGVEGGLVTNNNNLCGVTMSVHE